MPNPKRVGEKKKPSNPNSSSNTRASQKTMPSTTFTSQQRRDKRHAPSPTHEPPSYKKQKTGSTSQAVAIPRIARQSVLRKDDSIGNSNEDDDEGRLRSSSEPETFTQRQRKGKGKEDEHENEEDEEDEYEEGDDDEHEDSSDELMTLERRGDSEGVRALLEQEAITIVDDDDGDINETRHHAPPPRTKKRIMTKNAKLVSELPQIIESPGGNESKKLAACFYERGIQLVFEDGKKIGMMFQLDRVRAVVQAAFRLADSDMIHQSAFPDRTSRYSHTRNLLIRAAGSLREDSIVERLRLDQSYGDRLGSLINQNMTQFRSDAKKDCSRIIRLRTDNISSAREAAKRLIESQIYHFPISYKTGQILDKSKPYGNPDIAAAARLAFFTNGARSKIGVGNRTITRFGSSIWGKESEKELSVAMVALVCTAIHCALEEVAYPGVHVSFSHSKYSDIYLNHVSSLEKAKIRSPNQFHKTMHQLYNDAVGAGPFTMAQEIDPLALAEWSVTEDSDVLPGGDDRAPEGEDERNAE